MPLIIDSYRRFEEVDGYPDRPALLYVNDGTRDTGASVLVGHSDAEFASTVADAISNLLPDATLAIAQSRHEQTNAEERARLAHAAERDAKDRLEAVLHGRRRLFGEALVRVAADGAAWLMDPVKQEAGMGFRFDSLADLWHAHPELRPVRWDGGDLIVDATIAARQPSKEHRI